MACSTVKEVPVFAHTNLGTRIVIAVSTETTVGDFKKEFERAHLNCFREHGEIRVYGLKVKKKSCFYNLPESFPLQHVFQSLKDNFLHIEVYHLQHEPAHAESPEAEICGVISDFSDFPSTTEAENFVATRRKSRKRSRSKKRSTKRIFCFKSLLLDFPGAVHFLKRKKKTQSKRRRNIATDNPGNGFQLVPHFTKGTVNHFASRADSELGKKSDNNPQKECPSETFSETVSVSGIIKRYFTNYDEVTSSSGFPFMAIPTANKEHSRGQVASKNENREFDMSLPLRASAPPEVLHSQSLDLSKPKSSRGKDKKSVGRRIIAASDNLGVFVSKPKSSRGKDKKSVGRRIIAASDNLGVFVSKPTPTLTLCKSRDGKTLVPNSPIKRLVFDITDEDD